MRPADSIFKPFLILGVAAALSLGACSGAETASPTTGEAPAEDYLRADDYILGKADAPVTVLEYASVACGACAVWHQTVYPELKEKYVDTGKVKYVFRPFPAADPEMARAGHKLAYCAPRDKFFKNIKLQFDRQQQIFNMLRGGQGRQAYVSLAKASGLSEAEFTTCLTNPEIEERYQTDTQAGIDMGVSGTPTIFVNGVKLDANDLASIEAAGGLLGEPEAAE
jgi:protein-disulfide isomerase